MPTCFMRTDCTPAARGRHFSERTALLELRSRRRDDNGCDHHHGRRDQSCWRWRSLPKPESMFDLDGPLSGGQGRARETRNALWSVEWVGVTFSWLLRVVAQHALPSEVSGLLSAHRPKLQRYH